MFIQGGLEENNEKNDEKKMMINPVVISLNEEMK